MKAIRDLENLLEDLDEKREQAETAFDQLSQRVNQLSSLIAAVMKSQADAAADGTRGIS